MQVDGIPWPSHSFIHQHQQRIVLQVLPGKRLDTIGNIPPRDGLVWYTHALSLSLSIAISAGETDLEQGRVALVRYSLSLSIYIYINFRVRPAKKGYLSIYYRLGRDYQLRNCFFENSAGNLCINIYIYISYIYIFIYIYIYAMVKTVVLCNLTLELNHIKSVLEVLWF